MPGPYKIGEAAALLNLKTYVLRFWETEFPQIVPSRTETGRRVYTEEDLALLDRIRFLLYEHGLTIEGARRVLSEEAAQGVRYSPPSTPGPAEKTGGEEVVVAPTTPVQPAPPVPPTSAPVQPTPPASVKPAAIPARPTPPTPAPSPVQPAQPARTPVKQAPPAPTMVARTLSNPAPQEPDPAPPAKQKRVSRNTLDDMLPLGDEDGLSASYKDFLCELRAELEKVKALLAGSAPQGDHSA